MTDTRYSRRTFLTTTASAGICGSLILCNPSFAASFITTQQEDTKPDLAWTPANELTIEGRGFDDTASFYHRLPARAEQTVRPEVWNLSRMPSGMMVRFLTDSPTINVRYQLGRKELAMAHMPATSVSGVDLYAADESGKMQWAAVARPGSQEMNVRLLGNIKPTGDQSPRRFDLYLPLYNTVENLEIGIAEDCSLESAEPRTEKPIVIYGTSIMHGACASRSGMSISAILGRRLNLPVINLGFSGNGRMELEVGKYLCELDPSVYVIDCLPNLGPAQVTERCEPLIQQLRETRPDTPILLVEDRVFTNAWIRKGAEEHHRANRQALRAAYDRLIESGVTELNYLEGTNLLGDDHDGATDGSHPNDLGMTRYVDVYEPKIREILNI